MSLVNLTQFSPKWGDDAISNSQQHNLFQKTKGNVASYD